MPEYVQILSFDHQKNTHFQLEGVFLYPTTAFPLLRTILKRDWKLPRHENNTYLDFYDNHFIAFCIILPPMYDPKYYSLVILPQ